MLSLDTFLERSTFFKSIDMPISSISSEESIWEVIPSLCKRLDKNLSSFGFLGVYYYRLHSICFVVKARKYIAFLFVAVEAQAEACASGMVYGAT